MSKLKRRIQLRRDCLLYLCTILKHPKYRVCNGWVKSRTIRGITAPLVTLPAALSGSGGGTGRSFPDRQTDGPPLFPWKLSMAPCYSQSFPFFRFLLLFDPPTSRLHPPELQPRLDVFLSANLGSLLECWRCGIFLHPLCCVKKLSRPKML